MDFEDFEFQHDYVELMNSFANLYPSLSGRIRSLGPNAGKLEPEDKHFMMKFLQLKYSTIYLQVFLIHWKLNSTFIVETKSLWKVLFLRLLVPSTRRGWYRRWPWQPSWRCRSFVPRVCHVPQLSVQHDVRQGVRIIVWRQVPHCRPRRGGNGKKVSRGLFFVSFNPSSLDTWCVSTHRSHVTACDASVTRHCPRNCRSTRTSGT